MTTKHNISRAGEIYAGAMHKGCFNTNKRAGAPIGNLVQVNLGQPALGAVDTVATAQAVAAAGLLTIAAPTLDVARAVSITSSGADTAVVFTVTGTDIHGVPVVEEITGVNITTIAGKKAFKTVTSVAASGTCAGNISVGDTDALGLPYAVTYVADVMAAYAGATEELASGVLVAGDFTSPATATTGDVRGTYNPSAALNGATDIIVWMKADGSSPESLGGVDQYAG